MKSYSDSYREAGVDVTAGYRSVELMKADVKRTHTPGVMTDIGGFGGLFMPDLSGVKTPVLVSGTDGVGTKLRIAFILDKHDTIGQDCVAMCANDVVCCGAKPLFFLDYLACGKNVPEKIAAIVKGVADGCVLAGCALIGGETAEMPGFYPEDEYDLAGYCTALVDRDAIIDGSKVKAGDVLIGLASSGLHSNGYSLTRKAFGVGERDLSVYSEELSCTIGEELLRPTRIYVKGALAATATGKVKAVSHITGGGFYENIPRMLPEGVCARIEKKSVPVKPVFTMLQRLGGIPERDMFNTYNMGVGMMMAVAPEDADQVLAALKAAGEQVFLLGETAAGDSGVELW